MTKRDASIENFLEANGQGRALRKELAGDASVRRYERLRGGDRPAILMDVDPLQPDAPAHQLDLRPFVRFGDWLRQKGWSAPSIFAVDLENGLMLLEDLGDDLFKHCLEDGDAAREIELYAAAIDLLLAIQAAAPPEGLPAFDDAKMLEEAGRFTDWYAPALGVQAKADFLDIWREVLTGVRVGPDGFVYVDYHAENLIWLPARHGLARLGLLDFQDARLGPPAYDLVSLLEDARRDVRPGLATLMIERYLAARPEIEPEAFKRSYAILGAQRNCKILGLIAHLASAGKPQYLAFEGRVRAHLQHDLAHPSLAPLAAWFDRHIALNIAS